VTPGEEGLLYIAGRSVFQGYWNRPVGKQRGVPLTRTAGAGTTPATSSGGIQTTVHLCGPARSHGQAARVRIELGEIECGLYLHPSDPRGCRASQCPTPTPA
jgi:hypothetical protein